MARVHGCFLGRGGVEWGEYNFSLHCTPTLRGPHPRPPCCSWLLRWLGMVRSVAQTVIAADHAESRVSWRPATRLRAAFFWPGQVARSRFLRDIFSECDISIRGEVKAERWSRTYSLSHACGETLLLGCKC